MATLAAATSVISTIALGEPAGAVDSPRCGGRPATIVGTRRSEVLSGTEGNDVIVAGRGADRVNALGGDDVVCGEAGNDRISGGEGSDSLRGQGGHDVLVGESGDDHLVGGAGTDRCYQDEGSGGRAGCELPLRAAFYYPWFPETWDDPSDPYTNFTPSLGLYSSEDTAVVRAHIDAMLHGHVRAGIASWFGRGSRTDQRLARLLKAARGTPFRWTVYYEAEEDGDPAPRRIRRDLEYLRKRYASHPRFLHLRGRFVVFVYASSSDDCSMVRRWERANNVGAYVVLKVFSDYDECPGRPDGWHQYGPEVATHVHAPHSFTISPGFWKVGEDPRLERDLARWTADVEAMARSRTAFHLVTTFNEWGEGTAVESADEWASPSGYGQFLDALHAHG